MRIAALSLEFENKNINKNADTIKQSVIQYSGMNDLVIFPEAFLQGYDGISFNFEKDKKIAVSLNDEIIHDFRRTCKEYNTGLVFSYYELFNEKIYLSSIFIDKNGNILYNYRSNDSSYKYKDITENYGLGGQIRTVNFMDKKFIMLIGEEIFKYEIKNKIRSLKYDIILILSYTQLDSYMWWEYKEKLLCELYSLEGSKIWISGHNYETYIPASGTVLFVKEDKLEDEIEFCKEGSLIAHI